MNDKAHDRSLERVLGPALRNSLRDGSDACPDAETLAAWSENGLLPGVRSQVDIHLATCGRCQAHLAALARSEPVAERSPARVSRSLLWRWLIPAAAGATALAVWLAVQPDSPRPAPSSPQVAGPESTARIAEAPAIQAEAPLSARKDAAPPPAQAIPPAAAAPARSRAKMSGQGARGSASERDLAEGRTTAKSEAKTRAEETFVAAAPSVAAASPAADAVASLEIVSSDRSVRWRILGAELEHTVDGGATWTKQPTGTTVPLTAGVSPSPGVCWIVGRHGTVLRSIDGRTWQTVPFPEVADLIEVQSSGPAQATVTTTDARRFTTTDGGATWKAGALQEFSAAPF